MKGNFLKFDRESISTTFNYVANYVMIKYVYMIEDLEKVRNGFISQMGQDLVNAEDKVKGLYLAENIEEAQNEQNKLIAKYLHNIHKAWWNLHDYLYITYESGYINSPQEIGKAVYYSA